MDFDGDFLDDEDEVAFGAFDGEERDLELINALGMDIGDLGEAFGMFWQTLLLVKLFFRREAQYCTR